MFLADCALLFEVSFNHVHKIFKEVVCNWLQHKLFYPIDSIKYCRNDNEMNSVALQFSNSSCGIINGCIGALDRWLVKVKKCTKRNGVDNIWMLLLQKYLQHPIASKEVQYKHDYLD